ncbi:uncharacterized protein [Amphiura filiformis]|uniref:uncharacterized protein isoform X1 n=1 Tax=Amphiura filiformis TaxID=82378 RepID=UPI003B225C97
MADEASSSSGTPSPIKFKFEDDLDWSNYKEHNYDSDCPSDDSTIYYVSDEELNEEMNDKRRRANREAKCKRHEDFPLGALPDDVLLRVFRYLPFRDKCRLTRVNKKWRNLLIHRLLWTNATVPKVGQAWNATSRFRNVLVKFMKARFGPTLVRLDIALISAAGLRFLDQKCPNLLSLVLGVENASLDLGTLPSRLTFLELQFPSSREGHIPHDWWTKINSTNLPNLKSLAISGGSARIRSPNYWPVKDTTQAFKVFLNQLSEFHTLQHLELSVLNWEFLECRRDFNFKHILQHLSPLAQTLESFCIVDRDWVPRGLVKCICDEMRMLKHLKVSISYDDEESVLLKHLTRLPYLETLYMFENIALDLLKEVVPQFPKLKELHLYAM